MRSTCEHQPCWCQGLYWLSWLLKSWCVSLSLKNYCFSRSLSDTHQLLNLKFSAAKQPVWLPCNCWKSLPSDLAITSHSMLGCCDRACTSCIRDSHTCVHACIPQCIKAVCLACLTCHQMALDLRCMTLPSNLCEALAKGSWKGSILIQHLCNILHGPIYGSGVWKSTGGALKIRHVCTLFALRLLLPISWSALWSKHYHSCCCGQKMHARSFLDLRADKCNHKCNLKLSTGD